MSDADTIREGIGLLHAASSKKKRDAHAALDRLLARAEQAEARLRDAPLGGDGSHWAGCWRSHIDCAVARVEQAEEDAASWKAQAKHNLDLIEQWPLVEAVIEAARAQVSAEGRVTEEHRRLVDALAALDAAQKDGQTAGDGERVEAPAANDSLTPSKGEPVPAPAACPCDGTDCVC